jgi:hypothetical protein
VAGPHLDGAEITGAQAVRLAVDLDDGVTAQEVEALFERVDVWMHAPARGQLVHAEPRVHRAGGT